MPRWWFTLLLSSAAVAAAVLAPSFLAAPTPGAPKQRAPTPPAPTAVQSGPLHLSARLDQATWLRGSAEPRYLVVSVTAPAAEVASRVPVDVALVVDTSGSMGVGAKIDNARAAARELVAALRPGDRFSLVAFDDQPQVLLRGAAFDGDRDRLYAVIDGLHEDGGTNLFGGIESGYGELGDGGGQRRVLLVSDGIANVGVTEPAEMQRAVRRWAGNGVSVSAIGLGEGFNEVLLEGLADAGGGNYAFVAQSSELAAFVRKDMEEAALTVAQGVTVDVTLPPAVRLASVHGWETSSYGSATRIYVGDLYAGQERKIVLELSPDTRGDAESLHAADVQMTYRVPGSDVSAQASTEVAALLTDDAATASASVDSWAAIASARAVSGTYTKASAAAYRSGDSERGSQELRRSRSLLLQVIGTRGSTPELEADLQGNEDLTTLGYLGDSNMSAKAASSTAREMSK